MLTLSDFGIEIKRIDNGYTLRFPHPETGEVWIEEVIEDGDAAGDWSNDGSGSAVNLKSGQALLWRVMEYFSIGGSKHDKERLRVVREKQRGNG